MDAPLAKTETYDLSLLETSREKWTRSAGIRCLYQSIFDDILSARIPGNTLEIGSGCGFVKHFDPTVTTSDVRATPYCDRALSAYEIHHESESWANVIAFDVLHHLTDPFRFLHSASEALVSGGRIVLCEPAATPAGRLFYRAFHHEPCHPSQISAPYRFGQQSGDSELFANMGMAWALFERDKIHVANLLKEHGLRLTSVRYRDLLAYPASGGLSKPSLLPSQALRALLAMERTVPQAILKLFALRMIIVIEKS